MKRSLGYVQRVGYRKVGSGKGLLRFFRRDVRRYFRRGRRARALDEIVKILDQVEG